MSTLSRHRPSFAFPLERLTRKLTLALVGMAALTGAVSARGGEPDPSATLPDARIPGLEAVIDKAMTQSPQMMAQNIELSRAAAGRTMAYSGLYPSLSGNVRYADMAVSTTGTENNSRVGLDYFLTLSQPLFHWGELRAQAKTGDLDEDIAHKRYAQAYRDLVGQIRTLYLRLIIQKKALSMRERTLRLLEKSLAYDKQQLAAGRITANDYEAKRTDLDEAQVGYDRDALAFSQARESIAQLAGLKAIAADSIPSDLPRPDWSAAQAGALVTYFDQTGREAGLPSLEIARDQVRESELRYKIAKVRLLPKLDAVAQTSMQSQTYLVSNRATQSATSEQMVGVAVNWPIFDGFATRGAKQQALADKRSSMLQLQTVEASLDSRKRDAVEQCDLSARSLAIAERRLGFARGGLSYIEGEQKANRASEAQVEQARTAVLNAQLAAMSARADLYMRWSDLVGLLWMDPALNRIPVTYLSHAQ